MVVDWASFETQHGPVPRYRQVAEFVATAIDGGDLESGDALPTESQLADYLGVSVDTVRSALALLRTEGLIVTSQGIGSFVA